MKDRIQSAIQLDWSRLLGFDQLVGEGRRDETRLAKCGLKPGNVTPEVGEASAAPVALGHRIGAKIGSKPGFKPGP